jgi:cell division protein FtsZ
MKDAGLAHMGVGEAKGENKAVDAAKAAIASPLLETSIDGAGGILVNITVSPEVELDEVYSASSMITDAAAPDANIIWGATFDETLVDTVKITIIATGFDKMPMSRPKVDVEAIDETTVKTAAQVEEDEIADIINIINKNREKNTYDEYGKKW